MTQNELAYFMGNVVTLLVMTIIIVKISTENFGPIERRARRFAILAAVVAIAALIGAEVATYLYVSEVIASFMVLPSVGLGFLAVLHATRMTYRWMGGGKEEKIASQKEA